jgi:cholinesterase
MNRLFTCVARKSADIRIPFHIPTWRYRFFDASANNVIAPGAGAHHGADLPFAYGTPKLKDSGNGTSDTPDEVALTQEMMKAWAEFAKDPENGLTKLGYPLYEAQKDTLIEYGKTKDKPVSFGSVQTFDGACVAYEASGDSIDGIISKAKKRGASRGKAPF